MKYSKVTLSTDSMAMPNNVLKQNYLFQAEIAEKAKLYKDMVDYAEKLVLADPCITPEERRVFCCGNKNVINALRSSLDGINDYEENANESSLAKEIYMTNIKIEISNFCKKVLDILENKLIPSVGKDMESKIDYLKMKGDFYRYMAEVLDGKERDEAIGYAEKAYLEAKEIGEKYFSPIDKYRLAVALNLSVLYNDALGDKARAIRLSKEAFNDAMKEEVSKDSCKESFTVMSIMKNNLSDWTI